MPISTSEAFYPGCQHCEGVDRAHDECAKGSDPECPCFRPHNEYNTPVSREGWPLTQPRGTILMDTSDFTPLRNAAAFGRAVLRHILDDRDFFGDESSEEICELLAKFGYVERVIYDPDIHGEIDDAEPGFEVWVWTEAMKADAGPKI